MEGHRDVKPRPKPDIKPYQPEPGSWRRPREIVPQISNENRRPMLFKLTDEQLQQRKIQCLLNKISKDNVDRLKPQILELVKGTDDFQPMASALSLAVRECGTLVGAFVDLATTLCRNKKFHRLFLSNLQGQVEEFMLNHDTTGDEEKIAKRKAIRRGYAQFLTSLKECGLFKDKCMAELIQTLIEQEDHDLSVVAVLLIKSNRDLMDTQHWLNMLKGQAQGDRRLALLLKDFDD